MRLSRLFIDCPLAVGQEIVLAKDSAHYLLNVLRQRVGTQVTLFNGQGGEYVANLIAAAKKNTHLQVTEYKDIERESYRKECLKMSNVYIATTECMTAKLYDAEYIADKLYPQHLTSEKTNKLARRLAKRFGIQQRAMCIDLDRIPENVLRVKEDHPLFWCINLTQRISQHISLSEIGYIGIAFNVTSHTDNVPNLACQVAIKAGIKPEVMPEVFPDYGCAGGLFPIKSAMKYCQKNKKAALVLVFDQCNYRSYHNDKNESSASFSMDLKVNLLFSDGASAVLLIPERMRNHFEGANARVEEILTDFHPSDIIRFDNNRFFLGTEVKEQVPKLVADSVIKPIMAKNGLSLSEIEEWSIHQGGREVLKKFLDDSVLGLTSQQLSRSEQLFDKYGNFSGPSCFFVLDSFMQEKSKDKTGTWGMMVGFGAGLYQAALLYQWV
jgi:predicted naringenin-chalcone synthase